MLRSIQNNKNGLTYIEILVSLLLVIILVVVINTILVGRTLQKVTEERSLAYQLAQEEMEAVINQDFNTLVNTSSAPFINILYHRGRHVVTPDPAAKSSPHELELISDPGSMNKITAQAVLPKNNYDDFTLTFQGKLVSDTPAGSGVGVFFRASDYLNGYRVHITESNIIFDKVEDGVETNLLSMATFIATDTWYEYEIIITGDAAELRINTVSQFTVNDSTFTNGYTALITTGGGHAYVDDVRITESSGSSMWDFDTEPVGELAGEWLRQSASSLFNGKGELTISDYLGSIEIKEIRVQIFWDSPTGPADITLQTLVTG